MIAFCDEQLTIYQGDVMAEIAGIPDESVHCVITSPPYWGLRDYGTALWEGGILECNHSHFLGGNGSSSAKQVTSTGTQMYQYRDTCAKCGARRIDKQIGLERTPEEFVSKMVEVFREVRRVLRKDGTLWLNLGDSYSSGGRATQVAPTLRTSSGKSEYLQGFAVRPGIVEGLAGKQLIGIPWRVAFALQADGWVLRSEIIWAKCNPMPESVTDRPTKAHEQVFLFAKAHWKGPKPGRFAHISKQDARWLALCIDTEGCIVVKRVKQLDGGADAFGPQVTFGGANRNLVNRFAEIVGHGNIAVRPGKNAPMHYWQISNNYARDFLYVIYPYLIVKQRQARIGIYVDDLVYWRGGQILSRKQRTKEENDKLISLWERNKLCNHFQNPDLSDVPEPQFGGWKDCERYYYDHEAIKENGTGRSCGNVNYKYNGLDGHETKQGILAVSDIEWSTRNRRSVWPVATQPFSGSHFAVFPEDLVTPCILAGCPVGGTVLDPFAGTGTVASVANRLGRKAIMIELSSAYVELMIKRNAQKGIVVA